MVDGFEGQAQLFDVGVYEMRLHVGDCYRARGQTLPEPAFMDVQCFRFGLADLSRHYHLPVKLTPWGLSCFRGAASVGGSELTSPVKQNGDNARQTNEVAVSASRVVMKDGKVLGQVVGTMASFDVVVQRGVLCKRQNWPDDLHCGCLADVRPHRCKRPEPQGSASGDLANATPRSPSGPLAGLISAVR
ncbi:hydroxyisourate hydrolase [Variovorax sp. GT1P44]|uniref:hydroxyisourate hydrolase n=1 Tax=Variovorax sp. GT1P44 TaxID=3443742 RepID=UPI003F47D72C